MNMPFDINNRSYLAVVTTVASLGGFLFGFDMAVISGILPLVQKEFALSAAQEGWFVSCALVGCIIGVALSGELSDRFGRKKPLVLSAVLFLLSGLGCAFLPKLSWIIAARIAGGIGIGLASNVVPLYISEIAPANVRGRMVTFYQFALTLGILLAYLSNAGLLGYSLNNALSAADGVFSYIFISKVWRGMFAMEVIPSVLFLAGLFFVPESPRWLAQRGQAASRDNASYRELFSPQLRKAMLIGILLPLFSQFSGINAIIYYGPSILNNAGITLENSLASQVVFGLANMLFTLVAIWKVDSLGRRPLYIAGTAGATVALFLTGLCFYTGQTGGVLLVLCVLFFLACFAFSIGPLKFVVASEIFPARIRGRAMAVSIMVMWIADTIVGQLTPVLIDSFGTAATFFFFAFFCLVALVAVFRLLPETRGKTLEQIENEWSYHA